MKASGIKEFIRVLTHLETRNGGNGAREPRDEMVHQHNLLTMLIRAPERLHRYR